MSKFSEIIFYELPKLEGKVNKFRSGEIKIENLTDEEKWCIYMKYRHEERAVDLLNQLCQEDVFMHAEKAVSKVSRNYKWWARRMSEIKAELDYNQGINDARREGERKGKKQERKMWKTVVADKDAVIADINTEIADIKAENARLRAELEKR